METVQFTYRNNMSRNILITGASGYLGGSMLARLGAAGLPPYDKLYALVRTEEQANAVRKYGAEPLQFDVSDGAAVREAIIEKRISVVYWLISAVSSTAQVNMIKALEKVKTQTGLEVHLLHVRCLRLPILPRPPLPQEALKLTVVHRPPAPRYSRPTLERPLTGHFSTMSPGSTRFKRPKFLQLERCDLYILCF